MNAPNVTPGDWETGSLRRQVVVWPEGWNVPLCIADCGAKHAPESEAERCANALLIAKSKNLAEALRECITEGDATCFAHDGKPRLSAQLMRRRMLAINDIARAALRAAGYTD